MMKASKKSKSVKTAAKVTRAEVTKPVKARKPATEAAKPTKPQIGAGVALEKAGDLMAGPFRITPAALAAGSPAALRLREGSARFKLMAYAFAHKNEKIERGDLDRITGKQTGQALSGVIRYRFLIQA